MGQMRFLATGQQQKLSAVADRAYMAGMDGIPWVTRVSLDDDQMVVQRSVNESGNLFIPWKVNGHGEVVLSTTSLICRDEPYQLVVELARGTISRLRDQLAAWETAGLKVSHGLFQSLATANGRLVAAVTAQSDPPKAAAEAEQSIEAGLDAINQLGQDYTDQVLAIRHRKSPKLTTMLGSCLDASAVLEPAADMFRKAFNLAVVPCNWRDIELDEGELEWSDTDEQIRWCRTNNLKVCAGPLLRLAAHHVPDWLFLWEDDFENVRGYIVQFVDAVVERYHGKVQLWHVAAAMNTANLLGLSEEHKLRLTVDMLERIQRADARTPLMVSFDQPWGEYCAAQERDLSPLYFAETLVRAEIGLAAIGLELNLGYWPGGTLPRDPLDVSRLIDLWGALNVPLLVTLTIPSGSGDDPQARHPAKPLDNTSDGISMESQRAQADRLVRLLVAKQSVCAVIWNQFSDAEPHEFAHGGVLDAQGRPKQAFDVLASIRQEHLS